MTDWGEDPIEELARELRQGPGAELRAEAEITEWETHVGRLRQRSLSDVAGEAMHRGDQISVFAAGRTITGTLEFVGEDYLIVQTNSELVDVALGLCAFSVQRLPAGGHTTRAGSKTMKARVAEYEHTGELVDVVAPLVGVERRGRVRVAASDHVVLAGVDGLELHVPTGQIALVIRPRS